MDFLQKIGGRKFVMALIVIGAAMYLELHNPNGLSVNMAGFLATIVGAFSVMNHLTTSKYMDSKPAPINKVADISSQIDTLSQQIREANDPQIIAKLAELLQNILNGINEVKNVSGQLGTSVLNLGTEVREIKKRVQ